MPVLAAVDDFLFRSKIRAVAKHVGVEVQFAQTPEEILAQARALKPALVILDLNSAKADPVATIAALKPAPYPTHAPVLFCIMHVALLHFAAATMSHFVNGRFRRNQIEAIGE